MIKLSKLVSDVKNYAKLLNSVGQQGLGENRKRPLSPVECAKYIKRLIDEEGESLDKIAKRLNLGKSKDMSNMYKKRDTSQISMFLNLLNVSEKSRDIAGWNKDEYPLIPFSTIAQLAPLTSEEQDIIVQSILNSKNKNIIIGKEDVKKIKKWRNENPSLQIKECLEKILELKPVTITTHLVVCEITDRMKHVMDSTRGEDKLLDMLNDNMVGKFHSIRMGKSVIVISMDEEAYKVFYDSQYEGGVSYTQFLDRFLENKIG